MCIRERVHVPLRAAASNSILQVLPPLNVSRPAAICVRKRWCCHKCNLKLQRRLWCSVNKAGLIQVSPFFSCCFPGSSMALMALRSRMTEHFQSWLSSTCPRQTMAITPASLPTNLGALTQASSYTVSIGSWWF